VAFVGVLDDRERLEVGKAFSIAVSKAGKSLFVDFLNLLEIGGNVSLSGLLALDNEVP